MFRISKLTDYAMVVMTYLAANEQQELQTAKDITEQTHIALPTVTKILKILTKNRLLVSKRGANGGYCLAQPAAQISIARIIEAVEGHLGLTECSLADGHCRLERCCHTRQNWRYISQVIYNALQNISLRQMTRPLPPISFSFNPDESGNQSLPTEREY